MKQLDNKTGINLVALAAVLLALAGCQFVVPPKLYQSRAPYPEPLETGDLETGSTEFTVLTYNVEGLPWPARARRGPRLRLIERQLAAMKRARTAPDIVLIQEAFSREAISIARNSGYANVLPGPGRRDRRLTLSAPVSVEHVRERRLVRGERIIGKRANAGLYILTDFEVIEHATEPFSRRACAGFDCVSNKGVMLVRLRIPGRPWQIDVANTHFNSRSAARVSEARADRAHGYQVEESTLFLAAIRDPDLPAIYGGDFNMRRAHDRFYSFSQYKPDWQISHRFCAERRDLCEVLLSWDGDEPWMDTQDLQLFQSSDSVEITPVRIEAVFDAPFDGYSLSDHDGLLVTYRIGLRERPG